VFGIGLFGGLIGAFLFGLTSDRYGRKPNLLIAVGLFAAVTLLTPFVSTVPELLLVRFITGVGLGGALPGIISITSEFTPRRMRATVVGLMFCGFPLGAVVGGIVAAKLIPVLGWQAAFYVGGGLPLLLLPLIAVRLPESAQFLAMAGDPTRLSRILRRMNSPVRAEDITPEAAGSRSPVASLFTGGRASGTLLLWVTIFLSLLLAYLLTNWIPIVARQTGVGAASAILCTVAFIAGFYDTAQRATGVGWSLGIGRLGGIVGPVLGGLLVAAGMRAPSLFLLTGLASVGALLTLGWQSRRAQQAGPVPAEVSVEAH
jgi:MFS transporter, AAHS family, 4-hydroxybenzoate transporter